MQGYKASIREAELAAMSPESVFVTLQKLSMQGGGEHLSVETEESLTRRCDPLINLALARYTRNLDTIINLYQSAERSSAICLASLANPYVGKQLNLFRSFPAALFDSEKSMAQWLNSASDNELVALLENPSLSDLFLTGVLTRKGDWKLIEDERLAAIVYVLSSNPRMHTPRDDSFMDLYAETSYYGVFDAAWRLAQIVPVNSKWALALGRLYEILHPSSLIESPLDIAARWASNPSDADEVKNNSYGYLSDFQKVRKGIARLALTPSSLQNLYKHPDIAFRCAFWSAGLPSTGIIREACETDGALAFGQLATNLWIWRHSDLRAELQEAAWSIRCADNRSSLELPNAYNATEERLRKEHPAWFAGGDADTIQKSSDDMHKSAAKADVAELVELVERHARDTLAEIKSISSRISILENSSRQQVGDLLSTREALERLLKRDSFIRRLIVAGTFMCLVLLYLLLT